MNTTEPRLLRVEVAADLPVLWATFQRLDLPATLDRHFPTPQNWKGPLTPGEVLAIFTVSSGNLSARRWRTMTLGIGIAQGRQGYGTSL